MAAKIAYHTHGNNYNTPNTTLLPKKRYSTSPSFRARQERTRKRRENAALEERYRKLIKPIFNHGRPRSNAMTSQNFNAVLGAVTKQNSSNNRRATERKAVNAMKRLKPSTKNNRTKKAKGDPNTTALFAPFTAVSNLIKNNKTGGRRKHKRRRRRKTHKHKKRHRRRRTRRRRR